MKPTLDIRLSTALYLSVLPLFCLVIGYICGHNHILNFSVRTPVPSAEGLLGKTADFGILVEYPGKRELPCPPQSEKLGVILAIGQSNIANHGQKIYETRYPSKVFNYFDGRCYMSSSPLLGSTGEGGEFMTMLADNLVTNKIFESVLMIPFGVGGSTIARWQEDGDLNEFSLKLLRYMNSRYKITQIIWHQGEADFENKTSAKVYIKSFKSLMNSLQTVGVMAPTFISISTKCGLNVLWDKINPTSDGQKQLIDNKRIFLGVDTDTLLTDEDRQLDKCHLSESGQIKIASAYTEAIKNTSY